MCQMDDEYRELALPRPGHEQKCVKCKERLPVMVTRVGSAFRRGAFLVWDKFLRQATQRLGGGVAHV
uniref:Uncharacterized protein n=1 Tax=Equus caballus TaxID=9796 RepID=A0A9L0SVZ1_HORSE